METIRVYVRLLEDNSHPGGDEREGRSISFQLPERIPVAELLQRGVAIDGNRAMFAVGWDDSVSSVGYPVYRSNFVNPDGGNTSYWAFSSALAEAERELVDFLAEYDYTVQFA